MHRTGAIWMFAGEDTYARSSIDAVRDAGLMLRAMDVQEAARRWPQIAFDGIRSVFLEQEAGYLMAREACLAVCDAVVEAGGTYRQASLIPVRGGGALRCTDGSTLTADRYVVAAGPWLPALLPEIACPVQATRQEVFYFGTPAGDARFEEENLPVWVEMGDRFLYGIPGNRHRGFKFADDTRGDPFDPTHGDRTLSEEGLRRARRAVARRFPALDGAPLLESRVCQYENTPDGDFVIARHPDRSDLWIAGGGSGHGFKMGPAIGEILADAVLDRREPDPAWGLARFANPGRGAGS